MAKHRDLPAALLAACVTLVAAPAAAQDPPPPMVPSEAPEAPDAGPPPSALPPPASALPPPASALPPPASTEPPPPPPATATPSEPAAPVEPPTHGGRRSASARTLKGLTFPTPFLVDSAFITSHVGLGVELGHEWAYGVFASSFMPNGVIAMQGYQYDASLGVTTEYASLGVAIGESTEIGLDASYSSLVASDANSALLFGNQNAWTLRPGVRARLFSSPSSGTQMALHVYGNFGSGAIQNPQAILYEIANDISTVGSSGNLACLGSGTLSCAFPGNFNPQSQIRTVNTFAGGGGTLSLAQALGKRAGLQLALGAEAAYGWNDYQGVLVASTPIAFHVGLAPSYDLGPITLMGEYLFTVSVVPTAASSTTQGMSGDAGTFTQLQNALVAGAYYTARSDFTVGAFLTATFSQSSQSFDDGSPAEGQAPITIVTGQIAARYFF